MDYCVYKGLLSNAINDSVIVTGIFLLLVEFCTLLTFSSLGLCLTSQSVIVTTAAIFSTIQSRYRSDHNSYNGY